MTNISENINNNMMMPPETIEELNDKIINDDIMEYDNKEDLLNVIKKIKLENDTVINEYTDLVIMLSEQLSTIMPNSIISNNKEFIKEQIKKYGKFFMDGYIENAYMNKKTRSNVSQSFRI